MTEIKGRVLRFSPVRTLYLTVPCEYKADAGPDATAFEGYASIFGNVDLGGDIVAKGAFRKSIKEQKGVVPLFWRHDQPIGTALVEEDETGLKTLGSPLVEKVQLAREAMALVQAGAVKQMSFGYVVVDGPRDGKTGIRTLKELKLLEVSLVPFGMNPGAGVTGLKSAEQKDFVNAGELLAALREGRPLSEEFAKALALLAYPVVQEREATLIREVAKAFSGLTR